MRPEKPARLLRSNARPFEDRVAGMEEIAAGPLARMVRLALADPDTYLYPYRIVTEDESFDGSEIALLAERFKL